MTGGRPAANPFLAEVPELPGTTPDLRRCGQGKEHRGVSELA
jgi:hypothetical protein